MTERSFGKSHYFDLHVLFITNNCNVNCFDNFVCFMAAIKSRASLNLSKQRRRQGGPQIWLTAEALRLLFPPFPSVIANTLSRLIHSCVSIAGGTFRHLLFIPQNEKHTYQFKQNECRERRRGSGERNVKGVRKEKILNEAQHCCCKRGCAGEWGVGGRRVREHRS